MAGGLKLQDLNWGMCNDLTDSNQSQLTGDPRRTSALGSVQRATELAYLKDTIGQRSEYNGFVVGFEVQNFATFQNRAQMFQAYTYYQPGGTPPKQYENVAYKVYLPELMPQPAPRSDAAAEETTKLLATYPDVYSELEFQEAIPKGSFVTVRFEDPEGLQGPKIVKIIERAVGVVGLSTDASGNMLESAFLDGIPQQLPPNMGVGPTPGQDGNNTEPPLNPVSVGSKDPGGMTWSNKAKQLTLTWQSSDPKYAQWNGQVIKNGEIEQIPGFFEKVNGAKLIKPAAQDFRRLATAFKKKFGFPLIGSGYRSYAGQVSARMKRVSGDLNGCNVSANKESLRGDGVSNHQFIPYERKGKSYPATCTKVGVAAVPGTSNHGWGAAVDLSGKKSGVAGGMPAEKPPEGRRGVFRTGKSEEFRWVNKYGPAYNFVFGVSGEHWHINWLPFAKLVTGTKPPRMRKTSWVEGAASDPITKV